jgi:hypothetical protein
MTDGLTPGVDGTAGPESVEQEEQTNGSDARIGRDDAGSGPPTDEDWNRVEHDDQEVHGGPTLSELDESN